MNLMKVIKFDKNGLVPAVVQEGLRGRVLMVAYMDRRAFLATIRTGLAHYYSRSRKRMWKKGEESGHVQVIREIRVDCDGDTVLLVVRQKGPGACHTGCYSCFYRRRKGSRWVIVDGRKFDPKKIYRK